MWFFRLFLVGAVCQLLHKPRTYVERWFCELKRSLRMLTRDAAPDYVVINSILHSLGAFFESELGGLLHTGFSEITDFLHFHTPGYAALIHVNKPIHRLASSLVI